jgi:hypothetical protein
MTGELLYKALHADTQGPGGRKTASLALNSLGVPGLKYFDGFSRNKKKGTHNIVLWDQGTLNTLEVPIPDKTFWSLQQKPALSGLFCAPTPGNGRKADDALDGRDGEGNERNES